VTTSKNRLVISGRIDGIRETFYAITAERKVKHPAIVRLTEAAHARLFA
jgi:LysR family transcriptional activator of nhaA